MKWTFLNSIDDITCNVRNHTFQHVCPEKIQISREILIQAVWSESSPGAFWITKGTTILHADNEYSEQIERMRRVI